ncbi:YeeE/YedE family protein [Altericroceibacterium spongiae]|uniref:YeeE/YedE family protein n=1 Tax=Altericroceibacterium spongiae TaxID=2320269 RepID=A0A420EP67_9SPHN|nr:YeeE/YedE thiosulfate transporter family protein [Altericroceibacterium spongiae]RKF22464.1 YeeE/YedE family protein [Altericroceibacterium spongiae]
MLPGFPHAQPIEGFLGGLLIGLAAAIMLLGLGRIAGISGLFARAAGIGGSGAKQSIAILFILGLIAGAALFSFTMGPIEANFPPDMLWLIPAGLLVGFGTRLGSGCTSGHGVCGMSRLSRRSIVATLTFMITGFATVAIVNALGGSWS